MDRINATTTPVLSFPRAQFSKAGRFSGSESIRSAETRQNDVKYNVYNAKDGKFD